MNALTTSIFNALSADSTLAGLLSTYEGQPAIISADPVPNDVQRPYVVIDGAMHDEPWDGKVEEVHGREIHLDLRMYTDASGSSQVIDSIAERVRALLHLIPLNVTGYTTIIARCIAGPLKVPTAPQIMGRMLTFQWTLG
ncbi:MAG: DUF3168 domain-containing protein [Candidatus Binatus sp.]